MPPQAQDYTKAKIYKIINDIDDKIYIGSTTQPLNERFCHHKCDAKKAKHSKLYQHMNDLGFDHFEIELLEEYTCDNQTELETREAELIRKFGTLNTKIPNRTREEWYQENKDKINKKRKQHREDNKYEINQKSKKYYKQNKEKIKHKINEKGKQEIKCDICDLSMRKDSKSRHLKSKKHLKKLQNINKTKDYISS